jgi:hypothetical protein
MGYKRFLRDGVLERLLDEVRQAVERLPGEDEPRNFLAQYLQSIIISYETNKITLERIEEAIEIARPHDATGEIYVPLCEAATHIKSGILSLHEALWRNLEPLRDEMNVEFDEFESLVRENYLG